jgi:hypothetical protein
VGFHREFLPQVWFLPHTGISFSCGCEKCLELTTVKTFSGRQSIGWAQRRRLPKKTGGYHRRRAEKRRPIIVILNGGRRRLSIKRRERLDRRIIRGRKGYGNRRKGQARESHG